MDAEVSMPQTFVSQRTLSISMLDAPASTSYPQHPQQHLPTIHVSGSLSPYPTPAPSPGPNVFASTHGQPQTHPHPTFGSEAHPGFASSTMLRANHSATPTPPLHTAAYTSSPLQGPDRKPRVTMGPRADCEKCRLGVKGHWMHFD
ncbi:hypothetical protein OF83DRAFT_92710 [Amylostereum chailletii]|nr:hypothetical protein OF83DRAFT_92710 [Amylostereum chailletii]